MNRKSVENNRIALVVLPILFGAIMVVLLQTKVIHLIFGLKELQLPLPSQVAEAFFQRLSDICTDMGITLLPAVVGLILGGLIGYGTALLAVRLVKRQVNAFASAACCGAASVAFSRLWGIAAAFVRGYSVDFYAGVLKMLPAVCLTAIAAAFLTLVGSAILKSAPFRTREGGVKYR